MDKYPWKRLWKSLQGTGPRFQHEHRLHSTSTALGRSRLRSSESLWVSGCFNSVIEKLAMRRKDSRRIRCTSEWIHVAVDTLSFFL